MMGPDESSRQPPAADATTSDQDLIEALIRGDDDAFESLVRSYHASMMRLALIYVNDRRLAEEVIQETWIGVLRGLSNFERRSSLKTWIFSILMNKARTHARREGRYVLMELDDDTAAGAGEAAVPPERFKPSDHPSSPHHWLIKPQSWDEIPETRLLSLETQERIRQAIDALPPNQREVITLRDIEHWGSEEVCNTLGISETNQRVLLHRARSRVRNALEQYFKEE